MTFYSKNSQIEYARDEGIAIGRAEGKAEAKAEDILELLEDRGVVSKELRKGIMNQNNLNILSRWHRLAARSQLIAEFENSVLYRPY